MKLPSIDTLQIAIADPVLFENLMRDAGFNIVKKTLDPLNKTAQQEEVAAVANMMNEDINGKSTMSDYQRKVKKLAEKHNYIATLNDVG